MKKVKEQKIIFPLTQVEPTKREDMQNLAQSLMTLPKDYLLRIAGAVDFAKMMPMDKDSPVHTTTKPA